MGDIFLGRPLFPKHRLTSGNIDTLNYFWSKGRFECCLSKAKRPMKHAFFYCVYFLCSHAEFSLPKYTVMSETKRRIDCSRSKKRTEGQSPQIALPRPRARLQAPPPSPLAKKFVYWVKFYPELSFCIFFLGRRLLTKTSVDKRKYWHSWIIFWALYCVYFLCSHAESSLPKYTVMSETKRRIDCSRSKKRPEGQSPQTADSKAPSPPPPTPQILPGLY